MRPSPFAGVEQMWDAPIEEGAFRLVEDFSAVRELSGVLLTREELSAEMLQVLAHHAHGVDPAVLEAIPCSELSPEPCARAVPLLGTNGPTVSR